MAYKYNIGDRVAETSSNEKGTVDGRRFAVGLGDAGLILPGRVYAVRLDSNDLIVVEFRQSHLLKLN